MMVHLVVPLKYARRLFHPGGYWGLGDLLALEFPLFLLRLLQNLVAKIQ